MDAMLDMKKRTFFLIERNLRKRDMTMDQRKQIYD